MGKVLKKKTHPKLIQPLNFGCYPGTCMFILGFTLEEAISRMKRQRADKVWIRALESTKNEANLKGAKYWAHHVIFVRPNGDEINHFFIFMSDWEDTNWYHATIAHEALHIIQYYLPGILDRNTEHEAEAYLHTHLMRQMLSHIQPEKDGQCKC